jgi:hypothetical protein
MGKLTAGSARGCERPSPFLPGRTPFITVIDDEILKEVACGKSPEGELLYPSAAHDLVCTETNCIYNASHIEEEKK